MFAQWLGSQLQGVPLRIPVNINGDSQYVPISYIQLCFGLCICIILISAQPQFPCRTAKIGESPVAELTVFDKYVFSLYFAVQTLFTVGYGDLAPKERMDEIWVACISALLGAYLYALIIANATSVLINMDVTYTRYKTKVDELHEYMHIRAVPGDLQHQVMMYFRYIYDRQKGESESSGNSIQEAKEFLICVHDSAHRRETRGEDYERPSNHDQKKGATREPSMAPRSALL